MHLHAENELSGSKAIKNQSIPDIQTHKHTHRQTWLKTLSCHICVGWEI